MGGNALKNTKTRRYNNDEYFNASYKIEAKMWASLSEIKALQSVKSFADKETFGDLDILYSTADDTKITVEKIRETFSFNQIVNNGDVMSFDYEELQVDLIFSKKDVYSYASNYFSFNDLGNLVGKLFHKFGLKHGHKGLTLPLRDGSNEFAEITISTDHRLALLFVGLSQNRFNEGFKNLQEIFEFVSSSPFYNPDFYKLENLNHIAKVRDKKRSTYNEFLEYGETYSGPVFTKFKKDKSEYLEEIFEFFPDSREKFYEANKKYAAAKFIKTKFNGEMVTALTSLVGKDLGSFMKHLKKQFMFSDDMLMFLPQEKISQNILDNFKNFQ